MGHAVHVEAAKILLVRFYRELVCGTTIGHAVAQGRNALVATPARWLEYGPGARTLKLQDWFLPHLYQRGLDDPLLPGERTGERLGVTPPLSSAADLSIHGAESERLSGDKSPPSTIATHVAIHGGLTPNRLVFFGVPFMV